MTKQPPVLDSPQTIWDHLELVVNADERARRTLWLFMCDDQNRGVVVSPIDGMPRESSPEECRRMISIFAEALATAGPDTGLLVALTRPDPATVTETDLNWHYAVHKECADYGVRVLGVHLMTPTTHRAIAPDDLI